MRSIKSFCKAFGIEMNLRNATDAMAICAMFIGLTLALHAQGGPASVVGAAVNGHGAGWQDGAVKTWVAVGTLTSYRYDTQGHQMQETFPMTLIHLADPRGDGSSANRLQRLVFNPLSGPPETKRTSQATTDDGYSPYSILSKVGTDGTTAWHSAGPLSTKASGHAARFIESQTKRSLEALFNFQKHGKNLMDVTADILAQGPTNPGQGHGRDSSHSHATPNFVAAQNRHVIEMGGAKPKKPGIDTDATRYYIDDATSLVTRLEFDYAEATDPFSQQPVALTEVYEFSDYRDVPLATPTPFSTKPSTHGSVNGATVKFPFRIDRYDRGQLVESLVFSQVALNLNLRLENFRK